MDPHGAPSPATEADVIGPAREFLLKRPGFGVAFLRTSDQWRAGLAACVRELYTEARRLRTAGSPASARLLERYAVVYLRDPLRPLPGKREVT
jgi:hypothetical protein